MKTVLFIGFILIVGACTQNKSNNDLADKYDQDAKPVFIPQDTTWKSLTLRQKIGQTMLMLPEREKELAIGNGSLETYFERYPVSGYFMGWKLFDGVKPENYYDHIRFACKEYQQASSLPLIFQQDYESGVDLPGMTSFPNGMTLGAANSPLLSYAYGEAVAKQSLSVGVQWVLHPVADLSLNPFNPIVNLRSISDDPERAISLLSKQISGLQSNGVAATIKHFPGDGVDYRDQHLLTSSNFLPFERWKEKEGRVFQELIDLGVACIMPGHITLPSYQTQKINGLYPPATLSKELLTDLLKGEMGFEGVIVSDAMVMGGFRGWYENSLESEIESFKAGIDMMLWPSYTYMDTLEARIIRGEIAMERLDDAVRRVWALKERFGLLHKERELIREITQAEKEVAVKTARTICEQAITLLRDRENALPLDPENDSKILVVGLTPVSRKGGDRNLRNIKDFAEQLRGKGFQVDFRHNILYETQGWEDDSPEKYDRIIVAVARTHHAPFGPLQFYDDEAQTIWGINSMPKEKIIVINFGNPYNTNEYFERVNTCINAYSNSEVMHIAVIEALMGNIPMIDQSPVDLDINSKLKLY